MRMVDRSDPYTLDFLVKKKMQAKRRRSKPYPKAVLDMVEDFQPGAREAEDFDVENEDFDFDFEANFEQDMEYENDDDEPDTEEGASDPNPESLQLLEEMDEIHDDEIGLGDNLAEYLSTE